MLKNVTDSRKTFHEGIFVTVPIKTSCVTINLMIQRPNDDPLFLSFYRWLWIIWEMLNVVNLKRGDSLSAFGVNKFSSKQGFKPRSSGRGSLARVTEAGVKEELEVLMSFSLTFLLLAWSAHLYLRTCDSPHTPTNGVARIFPLIPMLRPGIKLSSAQLHLFDGP